MVVNGRPLKRAKRRVTADLCDILTFPGGAGGGGDKGGATAAEGFEGPFRWSVAEFLSRHARLLPPPSILSPPAAAAPPHLLTWRMAFRVGDAAAADADAAVVELSVVEEDVLRSKSIYCDQCRVVGWSCHPVCGKRYHFIIQNDGNPLSGCRQTCCSRCGTLLPLSESRCPLCKYESTADELEDGAYIQLEDSSHLLHAVVHGNGYGHLLRVNGREGGSRYLTGRDIMGFWDRLCKLLHVRKVTVMDISKKYGMEYRLLHAVTRGSPWYGEWGYQFGAGSYALTGASYLEAVETLSNIPLSLFFSHTRSPQTKLHDTISLYLSLSCRQLETVRDLFCYITNQLHDAHKQSRIVASKKDAATSRTLCAWTKKDVEQAEYAMVKVLRAVGMLAWVARRALRGATSKAVAPLELLDYCLNGLAGKTTDDGLVVAIQCNDETSTVEYRLEPATNKPEASRTFFTPSAKHLLHDLKFLYDALLYPATMQPYNPEMTRAYSLGAASKLLDCKQFIKHLDEPLATALPTHNPFKLCVWCHVVLIDHPKDYTAPPPELLLLSPDATVADLKSQATKAFQETYLVFQRFQAEQLLDCDNVSDSDHVKLNLGRNATVRVGGRCVGGDYRRLGQFRMERGLDNWTVDCTCGAKDDDGERMLACDTCGVWQHTRCMGINDAEEVPAKFMCRKCAGARKAKGRNGGGGGSSGGKVKGRSGGGGGRSLSMKRCKDEIQSASSVAGRFGRLTSVG